MRFVTIVHRVANREISGLDVLHVPVFIGSGLIPPCHRSFLPRSMDPKTPRNPPRSKKGKSSSANHLPRLFAMLGAIPLKRALSGKRLEAFGRWSAKLSDSRLCVRDYPYRLIAAGDADSRGIGWWAGGPNGRAPMPDLRSCHWRS